MLARYPCRVLYSVIVVALVGNPALADIRTYTAELNGANETPPVATSATGLATIVVDTDSPTNEMVYHLEYSGLSSLEIGNHFHEALAGVSGPRWFGIGLGSPQDGTAVLDATHAQMLDDGGIYINVHTDNFTAGEIRGNFYLTSTVSEDSPTWEGVKLLFR